MERTSAAKAMPVEATAEARARAAASSRRRRTPATNPPPPAQAALPLPDALPGTPLVPPGRPVGRRAAEMPDGVAKVAPVEDDGDTDDGSPDDDSPDDDSPVVDGALAGDDAGPTREDSDDQVACATLDMTDAAEQTAGLDSAGHRAANGTGWPLDGWPTEGAPGVSQDDHA